MSEQPEIRPRSNAPRFAAMSEAERAEHGRAEREHAEGVYEALGLDPHFDAGAFDAMLDAAEVDRMLQPPLDEP